MNSLWDGWTNQFYGDTCSDLPEVIPDADSNCALTWLWFERGMNWNERVAVAERIAPAIRAAYSVPAEYGPIGVLIYANNTLRLTPDDFRRIDLLTQQESAGMPAVEALVESVEVGVGR